MNKKESEMSNERVEMELETKIMNKENSMRVKYLDTIKAISILLVVFCHTPILKGNSVVDNVAMILCWSAVPCFFMTTGAIYLNKEWNFKKYIYKLVSIYIIMCIWKIIYLIIYQCIGTINILDISKKLIFNYIFLLNNLPGIVDGHFWFMYAYLSIFIIYPIFNLLFKNIKENKNYIIFILIILFIVTALTYTINLIFEYFHIDNVQILNIRNNNPFGKYSHMLLYFLIGGILYKYNLYDRFKNKKIIIRICSILFILLGIIGLVIIKKFYNNTFEWQNIYLKDGYNWTSTILLSLGVFVLFQGVNFKFKIFSKVLNEVGKNTIGIFYLHILVLEILRILKPNNNGSLINLIKSIIVIAICYAIIVIIKKIPFLKKIVQ